MARTIFAQAHSTHGNRLARSPFLDKLCTKIVEIERGVSTVYLGNYSNFVTVKEELRAAQLAAYERQREELERQQTFIDRFRASATRSTQAKSREKQLDKIEIIEAPETGPRTLEFHFPPGPRSGKTVVEIKKLMHGYGEKLLFLDASLTINKGDRIAFLGKWIREVDSFPIDHCQEKPMDGVVALGEHNVYPAYFAQNQAEAMDMSKTCLETISDMVHNWKDSEIRGLLGRFLFSGDTVFKRVKDLSGGEKARLALANSAYGFSEFSDSR